MNLSLIIHIYRDYLEKMAENIIKSKDRVRNHAEVYTPKHIINSMLDLVKSETQRIESRFLEPACGNGNFLVEILNRKLNIIVRKYKKNQCEFELYSVVAIGSMYGVDILKDNVFECRKRLFDIWANLYKTIFKEKCKKECMNTIKYILSKNILWGNALTLKTVCENETPIIFAQWSAINSTMIKRRDYTLSTLLYYQPMGDDTLFSDLGDRVIIPPVTQDYPPIHYLQVPQYD